MNTINFTRGVPANESFPIDEMIDAARASLRSRGAAMLQYGPAPGFSRCANGSPNAGGHADRILTGNGSLQLIEFLCLHLVKPGDRVLTEFRLRPNDRAAAPSRCRHPQRAARGGRSEHRGARSRREARAAEILLCDPRLSEPGRFHLFGVKRKQIAELARSTAFCSSKTRPTGCCGIEARMNQPCSSSRPIARCI